jgi:hypothetical protein
MTEASRTASPLSTADEFYIISACFGEVHGNVPVEQELAKITELYTTYYMLNTFRWRHPQLGPLFADAPGMNGHMNRLTLDLHGGAPTTEYDVYAPGANMQRTQLLRRKSSANQHAKPAGLWCCAKPDNLPRGSTGDGYGTLGGHATDHHAPLH